MTGYRPKRVKARAVDGRGKAAPGGRAERNERTTSMQVQPYLFFDGHCDEALDFYKKTLGATVDALMRLKEAPDQSMISPDSREKVMHCAFRIGDTQVLASDGRCMGQPNFQGFALTITAGDDAEAERLFGALGDGGQVQMPMSETFFASRFGMVADRFGASWMVLAAK
jgi:PhnB protein